MNEQNLRPYTTSEAAREGQKKSAKKRKENRTIRESMIAALNMPVTDEKQLATIKKAGLPVPKKPTYKDFYVASAILQSIKTGRMSDVESLMRIIGEDTAPKQTEDQNDGFLDALNKTAEGDWNEERDVPI